MIFKYMPIEYAVDMIWLNSSFLHNHNHCNNNTNNSCDNHLQ